MQDTAEDIEPRYPAYDLGLPGKPMRTLSYVEAAPQLGVLREEVAESTAGSLADEDNAFEAAALPTYLVCTEPGLPMSILQLPY